MFEIPSNKEHTLKFLNFQFFVHFYCFTVMQFFLQTDIVFSKLFFFDVSSRFLLFYSKKLS
jgi:hypothetical protein